MRITTIGIDIAKNVFHVMGLNRAGQVVLKKKLRRKSVLGFFAQVSGPCVVGIEACASSHYGGREFEKLGHEVRLIPPRYVKPFLRGNKNDYNDALAIAEACNRPEMRCIPIRTMRADIHHGQGSQWTPLTGRIYGSNPAPVIQVKKSCENGGDHIGI